MIYLIKVTPLGAGRDNNNPSNMKMRAKRNVIKTMLIVSIGFIICNSWNQWFFFLYNLDIFQASAFNSNFYHFSVVAMFANCCINPFIYAAKYEEFQKGLKGCFKKRAEIVSQSTFTEQTN